jgi:hypothetical protein
MKADLLRLMTCHRTVEPFIPGRWRWVDRAKVRISHVADVAAGTTKGPLRPTTGNRLSGGFPRQPVP